MLVVVCCPLCVVGCSFARFFFHFFLMCMCLFFFVYLFVFCFLLFCCCRVFVMCYVLFVVCCLLFECAWCCELAVVRCVACGVRRGLLVVVGSLVRWSRV